jgi:hypothetical protein
LGETPLNEKTSFLWIHIPVWEFAVFKFTFTTGHSLQQKQKSMQQLVHVVMEYFWNTA